MEAFQASAPDAFQWASRIPPIHWSKSHFTCDVKSDVLMNNIAESFNSCIINSRDKPIISLLENIRCYLMTRIKKKKEELNKCSNHVMSGIQKSINKRKEEAMDFICTWNGGSKYQIRGPWGEQYVVDLGDRSCTCRRWQLTGIPCKHGVSAIWYDGKNGGGNGVPEMWVHECYKKEVQAKIYEHTINPINGPPMWDHVSNVFKIVPPATHKQPGRPKKARRKAFDESTKPGAAIPTKVRRKGKVMKCSKCGVQGHNARGCKEPGVHNQADSSNNGQSSGVTGRGRSSTAHDATQDSRNFNVEPNHSSQVTLNASQLTTTATQENPRDASQLTANTPQENPRDASQLNANVNVNVENPRDAKKRRVTKN